MSSTLDLLSCIDLWRKINQLILHMNNKNAKKRVCATRTIKISTHRVCKSVEAFKFSERK